MIIFDAPLSIVLVKQEFSIYSNMGADPLLKFKNLRIKFGIPIFENSFKVPHEMKTDTPLLGQHLQ